MERVRSAAIGFLFGARVGRQTFYYRYKFLILLRNKYWNNMYDSSIIKEY